MTALQAALDDGVYFTGDEAVTVSVTSAGLVQLDVAGGAGTVVVAEHSAYRAGVTGAVATNGLAATLTGTVSNATALGNGFTPVRRLSPVRAAALYSAPRRIPRTETLRTGTT